MLNNATFFDALKESGIAFFTGVPDSLLKNFCAYITDNTDPSEHIIAANEGNSVAIGIGYHLATQKTPLIYCQNSGLGNMVNPLISLADPDVYSIPMLLLIGYRGEPGVKDEPQHVKQGPATLPTLEALDIPYAILPKDEATAINAIQTATQRIQKEQKPYALVIQKDTFEPYKLQSSEPLPFSEDTLELEREEAIQICLNHAQEDAVFVSTTGKISREVFESREATNASHKQDFLTVGGMGHCSQIALGIALQKPSKPVICLDGDGATLMHMGGLAIIGQQAPNNFHHILLNNGAHESVGGQPTVGFDTNFTAIAKACNYTHTKTVSSQEELEDYLPTFLKQKGPSLLEILVKKGARKDLGRPTISPQDQCKEFKTHLSNS